MLGKPDKSDIWYTGENVFDFIDVVIDDVILLI